MLPVAESSIEGTAEPAAKTGETDTEGSAQLSKVLGVALKDEFPAEGRISMTLRQGDGKMFAVSVHPDQTINQIHVEISRHTKCPAYALRLIFKGKVLSNYGDQTLRSFAITEGDIVQFVVVRADAAVPSPAQQHPAVP